MKLPWRRTRKRAKIARELHERHLQEIRELLPLGGEEPKDPLRVKDVMGKGYAEVRYTYGDVEEYRRIQAEEASKERKESAHPALQYLAEHPMYPRQRELVDKHFEVRIIRNEDEVLFSYDL